MQVKWCISRPPKHVTWYITWLFFDVNNVLKCKVSLHDLSGYSTTIPDTYEVLDSYIPCRSCRTTTSSRVCGSVLLWQALPRWGGTSCDRPPSYILWNHHDRSCTLVLQDHYHQWSPQCSHYMSTSCKWSHHWTVYSSSPCAKEFQAWWYGTTEQPSDLPPSVWGFEIYFVIQFI